MPPGASVYNLSSTEKHTGSLSLTSRVASLRTLVSDTGVPPFPVHTYTVHAGLFCM